MSIIKLPGVARRAVENAFGDPSSLKAEKLLAGIHWLMMLFVFLFAWLAPDSSSAKIALFAAGALGTVFTFFYHYVLPRYIKGRRKHLLELMLDVGVITFLVRITGSADSPFFVLYYLVLAYAALLLGDRAVGGLTAAMTVGFLVVSFDATSFTPLVYELFSLWVFGYFTSQLSQAAREVSLQKKSAAVQQASVDLFSSMEPQAVYKEVVGRAVGDFGFDRASLALVDKESLTLKFFHVDGDRAPALYRTLPFDPKANAVSRAIFALRPFTIEDLSPLSGAPADAEEARETPSTYPAAVVPLVFRAEQGHCSRANACRSQNCPLYYDAGAGRDRIFKPPAINDDQLGKIVHCPSFHVCGAIVVDNYVGRETLDEAALEWLSVYAQNAAMAIINADRHQETKYLTTIDALTRLYNRDFMYQTLAKETERARRYQKPLSVVFLDIDNFKQVNDTFGHQAGDRVIQTVSELLKANIRGMDLAARYGGDEFTLILPETNLDHAVDLAERVRAAVEEYAHRDETGRWLSNLTVSVGVAAFPESATTELNLIQCADEALLRAKRAGRNRVRTNQNVVLESSRPQPA